MKRARSPVAEQFGEELRRPRQSARLSQEELARRSGVHRTEVGLLERAARVPKIDTVLALTDALSVTPGSLLDGIKADGNRGRRRNA